MHFVKIIKIFVYFFLCYSVLFSQSLYAHHPLGVENPYFLYEFFLSGIGHPIIGLDHLAFLITFAFFLSILKEKGLILSNLLLFTFFGLLISFLKFTIPLVEIMIALSILAFGLLLLFSQQTKYFMNIMVTCLFGVFHGYAYSDIMVYVNFYSLIVYLLGLVIIQLVIIFTVLFALEKTLKSKALYIGFSSFFILIGIYFLIDRALILV